MLIDNPIEMRDAYAAGDVHIGWATLDMVPLIRGRLRRRGRQCRDDSRVMPRIYPAGRLVERRRRHRRPRGDQDGGRPARQDRSRWPRIPRRTTSCSTCSWPAACSRREVKMDFTRHGVRGGGGLQRRQGHRGRRLLGARHLQPGEGQGEPPAGHHRHRQQADRRRLVRPRRFCAGSSGHHRRPGARHLRRDGGTEAGRQQAESVRELMADGYGLPPADAPGHARRRPQHELGRELPVLRQPEQPDELRAGLEPGLLPLSPDSARSSNQPVQFDQVMDFSIIAKLGRKKSTRRKRTSTRCSSCPSRPSEVQGAEEILTNTVVIHFYPNS